MIRAKETCDIVSKFFPNAQVIEDKRLKEGSPSIVSPHRDSVNKEFVNNKSEDSDRISESFESYFKRCDTENDEHYLFVIHGNVIRYFLCRAL